MEKCQNLTLKEDINTTAIKCINSERHLNCFHGRQEPDSACLLQFNLTYYGIEQAKTTPIF